MGEGEGVKIGTSTARGVIVSSMSMPLSSLRGLMILRDVCGVEAASRAMVAVAAVV